MLIYECQSCSHPIEFEYGTKRVICPECSLPSLIDLDSAEVVPGTMTWMYSGEVLPPFYSPEPNTGPLTLQERYELLATYLFERFEQGTLPYSWIDPDGDYVLDARDQDFLGYAQGLADDGNKKCACWTIYERAYSVHEYYHPANEWKGQVGAFFRVLKPGEQPLEGYDFTRYEPGVIFFWYRAKEREAGI